MPGPWSHPTEVMGAPVTIIVAYRCRYCSLRYHRVRQVNSPKAEIQLSPPSADTHTLIDYDDEGCLLEASYIPKFEKHHCDGPDDARGYADYCGYIISRWAMEG